MLQISAGGPTTSPFNISGAFSNQHRLNTLVSVKKCAITYNKYITKILNEREWYTIGISHKEIKYNVLPKKLWDLYETIYIYIKRLSYTYNPVFQWVGRTASGTVD